MTGCLILGSLVILLFVVVPVPLWPILVVALVVLFVLAAALGLLRGIFGAVFGRWPWWRGLRRASSAASRCRG